MPPELTAAALVRRHQAGKLLARRWHDRLRTWPEAGRLKLEDRLFWAVQLLVVLVAVVHSAVEWLRLPLPETQAAQILYFVPVALFLVPVIYAALNFGLAGAMPTAVWGTLLSTPNILFFHHGLGRVGVVWQLSLVNLIAVFAGQRVDSELALRRRAESASAAAKASEVQLRFYAASLIDAQEAERQRIARDLHDETVQRLIQVCRQVDSMAAESSALSGLGAVRQSVEQAVDELRDFARDLRPPMLDDLGVLPAIRRLLTDAGQASDTVMDLEVAGEPRRLNQDAEMALFRIAQQAIHNVEQHAQAKRVRLRISFGQSAVGLEVADDGQGFALPSYDNVTVGKHFGLLGMRERAHSVGGDLRIDTQPGRGTRVSVGIPDRDHLPG